MLTNEIIRSTLNGEIKTPGKLGSHKTQRRIIRGIEPNTRDLSPIVSTQGTDHLRNARNSQGENAAYIDEDYLFYDEDQETLQLVNDIQQFQQELIAPVERTTTPDL